MSGALLSLYSGLMRLAQPLLRRKMAQRALQEPGYADAVNERFGYYTQKVETSSELVWLHAVSLGETRTAAILLKALREEHPGLRLLLTHGTATGRAEGRALLRPGDLQVWQPWDTREVVERFLEHFKPRLGVLMETEVWPCQVAGAKTRGLPLVLVNGRLSDKSLQRALRISLLASPAYASLTAVYAQTALDAEHYRKLGVQVAGVFGNLKFDATPSASLQATGEAWRNASNESVVMFASSREGEEALFIKEIKASAQHIRVLEATENIANGRLKKRPVKYLIVPRHPQRFDQVAALVARHGLALSRRSGWLGSPFENQEAMRADVWLGDTLGEMPLYYALSDVALLGGSFEKFGGQNLIEAAACGCPVVMGLHTYNFFEAAELAESAGAAHRVTDIAGALRWAVQCANSPAKQSRMAQAATAFAATHQGATGRTVQALAAYLT
jgi:3-deoxy-D-manno-octulosonic-acid transferase